jgi:Tfp pilus assembly protein PilZ
MAPVFAVPIVNVEAAPPSSRPQPPPPAPTPPSVPRAATVPASLDLIEAVTLDFSAPSAAEDADVNLDTADLDLEVTYASESNFYADVAGTDLGLFIATFVVKPAGTPLAVRLTVPQLDEPIFVSGTVRWVREFSPSIEAPPGMGVALRPVAANAMRAIEAFMKVRAPILHDD